MKFTCPSCGAPLNGPESAVGRRAKCPKCAHEFAIPAAPPAEGSAPPQRLQAEPAPQSSPPPSGAAPPPMIGQPIGAVPPMASKSPFAGLAPPVYPNAPFAGVAPSVRPAVPQLCPRCHGVVNAGVCTSCHRSVGSRWRVQGVLKLGGGLLLAGGGAAISIVTYAEATRGYGGTYFIFYGVIVAGLILVGQGLWQLISGRRA